MSATDYTDPPASGAESTPADAVASLESTGRPPRLLFLAYHFPPINTIGAVRAYNIAKWLARKGWEVTVVTPYESAWRQDRDANELHDELSRQGIRSMRTEHRWRSLLAIRTEGRRPGLTRVVGGVVRRTAAFFGVERETGWISEATKACASLVPDDADVVLASGPPFASFRMAKTVAERLGRPYVLDYRDLWTGNPHAKRVAAQQLIANEGTILAGSAAAIGVSPSLLGSLEAQFSASTTFRVISNGFDPAEMASVPRHDFGHFAIVYAGMFYPPKRTAVPVMAALQRVAQRTDIQKPWVFHYYGYQSDHVLGCARDFGVEDRVIVHGNVPRAEALAAVRGASMAVVISSVYEHGSLQDRGIVTGKVFEAIGLGTPLLVIAPEGSDLEGILAATGCGRRFSGTAIDGIAGYLQEALNGHRVSGFNPEAYSWGHIAQQLDGVLRDAIRRT